MYVFVARVLAEMCMHAYNAWRLKLGVYTLYIEAGFLTWAQKLPPTSASLTG